MRLKSLINKKYLVENTDDYEEFDIPKYSKETKEKQALASIMKMLKQKHIKGNLNLYNTKIESLGNLQSVGGDLDLEDCTELESLGNLESVYGSLNLKHTPIKSLGNLKNVDGDLNLEDSLIKFLGNLESVKGCLYLYNAKEIKSLGNLKIIDGLDASNSSLESLGNLQSVRFILISKGMVGKIDIPERFKNKVEISIE